MSPDAEARLSIIIPVHNGERHLASMLNALRPQLHGEVSLTMVLNGCVDGSETIARASREWLADTGADVRVLESPKASRAAALNLGDQAATGHRLYVDQDAVLSPDAVPAILAALDRGAHFVAAEARWRTPCPRIQAAMNAWNAAPYVREQVVTAGAYAVSLSGRSRWQDWPEGLPDDKYARLHFGSAERLRLSGVTYEVTAPDTFQELVQIRRRYRRFNASLKTGAPELYRGDGRKMQGLWRTPAAHWRGLALLAAAELLAVADPRR